VSKRIALLGFSIECNRFAPVTSEHDFAIRTLARIVVDSARLVAARHVVGPEAVGAGLPAKSVLPQ